MFVSTDGTQIIADPLPPEISNPENYFECDTLMTPIIALLRRRGYDTAYSCQGHVYSHYVNPLNGSIEFCDTSMENELPYEVPYIMFGPSVTDLPDLYKTSGDGDENNNIDLTDRWYIEYLVIKKDGSPVSFKNPNENLIDIIKATKLTYRIIIYMDHEYYNFPSDTDPYEFYSIVCKNIGDLYHYIEKNFPDLNEKKEG